MSHLHGEMFPVDGMFRTAVVGGAPVEMELLRGEGGAQPAPADLLAVDVQVHLHCNTKHATVEHGLEWIL